MSKLEVPGIARDNHYVPQAALRRWSDDARTVWACRLLVSRANIPLWQRMSIRNLASQRDLYTVTAGDGDHDDFEHWIAGEYEQPATQAIDKVVNGDRLKREDWHSLARFVALQDVRTLSGFFDLKRQLERDLPKVLDSTMREGVKAFKRAEKGENVRKREEVRNDEFSELIEVSIEKPAAPDSSETYLRAEMTIGRRLWLASMRHLLKGDAARVLCDHKWTIAEPAQGMEWPITDHPVLKLNYNGPGKYDFRGGWGRRRGNIMMPLTPKHLLFVEIGTDSGRRITFGLEKTLLVRKLLAERAHRWVFATQPLEWVSNARPRRVDAEAYATEQAMWERWHEDQSVAELSN